MQASKKMYTLRSWADFTQTEWPLMFPVDVYGILSSLRDYLLDDQTRQTSALDIVQTVYCAVMWRDDLPEQRKHEMLAEQLWPYVALMIAGEASEKDEVGQIFNFYVQNPAQMHMANDRRLRRVLQNIMWIGTASFLPQAAAIITVMAIGIGIPLPLKFVLLLVESFSLCSITATSTLYQGALPRALRYMMGVAGVAFVVTFVLIILQR
jgi:hypothetical protein